MNSGIYCIKSKIDNKVYVGSSVNIKNRFSSHKSHLTYNKHGNTYLQRVYNKYGINNLEFLILELCPESELGIKEKHYCDLYKCNCNETGYNLAIISEDRTMRLSEESYTKAVESRKKNGKLWCTKETAEKISKSNKGKIGNKDLKHSDEFRNKLSKLKTGTKLSEETKLKISKSGKGRKFTEEHKAKIAEKLRIRMKEITKCEHCDTEINVFNYRKYHGRNCDIFRKNEVLKYFKGKIHE